MAFNIPMTHSKSSVNQESILYEVKLWLEKAVVGLNLCPFAIQPLKQDKVHFELYDGYDESKILTCLAEQCQYLDRQSEIETSLVVLTEAFSEFDDYNQFLDVCDQLLRECGWEGKYQIASFHPGYCFAGVSSDCVSNWTNRAPYPILHILREASLEKALESFPEAEGIPEKNIQKLKSLSLQEKQKLFPYLISKLTGLS